MRASISTLFIMITVLRADQVTLKNGDTITGAIIKKDGDKLTVKSEFLGEVTMPWAAVTAVKSDAPLFVALPNGRELSGKLATQAGAIEIAGTSAPLSEVSAIRDPAEQHKHERLRRPGWSELWAGYFDLGLALARGNARTDTFTTALNAARVTRSDKTILYYNQIHSSATIAGRSGITADAVRGGLSYDHNLRPRLFANVFNDYESDRFQNLDLRMAVGGGLGFHAIKSERTKLDVLGGADYSRESFSNNIRRNSAEIYWGDDLTYKLSGITALAQSARMFDNISRSGEYRVNFDVGSVTTLRKWLSWQVTGSERFLSNPVSGRQRSDLLITTGLRVAFAR
jgi:uncharacterized protein DUF481